MKIIFNPATGKLENIPAELRCRWRCAFPHIDHDREIVTAELWLLANPKRRKKNYEKFLFNWFTTAAKKEYASKKRKSTAQPSGCQSQVPEGW